MNTGFSWHSLLMLTGRGCHWIPSNSSATCSSIRAGCCFIQACFLFWLSQHNCWTSCIKYEAADQYATDGLCGTNPNKISQPCDQAFLFLIITPSVFPAFLCWSYPGNTTLTRQRPCFSKWNTLPPQCNLVLVSFHISSWIIYAQLWQGGFHSL